MSGDNYSLMSSLVSESVNNSNNEFTMQAVVFYRNLDDFTERENEFVMQVRKESTLHIDNHKITIIPEDVEFNVNEISLICKYKDTYHVGNLDEKCICISIILRKPNTKKWNDGLQVIELYMFVEEYKRIRSALSKLTHLFFE